MSQRCVALLLALPSNLPRDVVRLIVATQWRLVVSQAAVRVDCSCSRSQSWVCVEVTGADARYILGTVRDLLYDAVRRWLVRWLVDPRPESAVETIWGLVTCPETTCAVLSIPRGSDHWLEEHTLRATIMAEGERASMVNMQTFVNIRVAWDTTRWAGCEKVIV